MASARASIHVSLSPRRPFFCPTLPRVPERALSNDIEPVRFPALRAQHRFGKTGMEPGLGIDAGAIGMGRVDNLALVTSQIGRIVLDASQISTPPIEVVVSAIGLGVSVSLLGSGFEALDDNQQPGVHIQNQIGYLPCFTLPVILVR
jgi:hypothetical protein